MAGRAIGQVVDITRPEQIGQWVAHSAAEFGGIDIVVPNVSALAGGSDLAGSSDLDVWRQAFETDLLGSVSLVDAALPWLRQSQAAAVVRTI